MIDSENIKRQYETYEQMRKMKPADRAQVFDRFEMLTDKKHRIQLELFYAAWAAMDYKRNEHGKIMKEYCAKKLYEQLKEGEEK